MKNHPKALISELYLVPHPEGGHYTEIYRSSSRVGFGQRERESLTSIYFLLEKGQASRWHVVDADEVWHFYEGDLLELWIMPPDLSKAEKVILGEVSENSKPVHVVPAGWWQAARPIGDYSLCGCTVAPAFEFAGFRFLDENEKKKVSLIKDAPEELL